MEVYAVAFILCTMGEVHRSRFGAVCPEPNSTITVRMDFKNSGSKTPCFDFLFSHVKPMLLDEGGEGILVSYKCELKK